MKNFIENKTVLVTGATSGIGKRLAEDLVGYGTHLILLARNTEKLGQIQAALQAKSSNKVLAFTVDVRDRQQVETVMADILSAYSVDILINNAGLASGKEPIYSGSIDKWENMIDTNLKGLLYVSKPIIAQMKGKDTAHVVNVGSVAGRMAYPGGNVYCATKAAVRSLTEAMNADLAGTQVKVSAIAPGAVKTNFSNVRFDGDTEMADKVYEGYTPLSAEDVSNTIIHIINSPKHVNIQYVDIMPTAQRNPYVLVRE